MDKFKDQVVIVTGAASGIGKAICENLAGRGAIVTASDINAEAVRKTAAAIPNATGVCLDVTDKKAVEELIESVSKQNGRIDYMFNNAGVMVFGEVRDLHFEVWRQAVDVNLMGVLYGTLAAYKTMVNQGHGHIVNTASIAGIVPTPVSVPYSVTKHGVVSLSSALRKEGAALGVKVTVVCPGFIETPMVSGFSLVNGNKEALIRITRRKFKRFMSPEKAAAVIVDGVEKNRANIVFPFLFRLVAWLYRLHPVLASPFTNSTLNDFRQKVRHETESDGD